MNTQIGGLRGEFNTRLHTEISVLRSEASAHFKWTIGTLVAVAGLTVGVLKL